MLVAYHLSRLAVAVQDHRTDSPHSIHNEARQCYPNAIYSFLWLPDGHGQAQKFLQVLLTLDDVGRLADGGIFGAQEAFEEKLIDKIGYLDEAIELAKTLAGIDKAQVVEYRKPFSLTNFLSYRKSNLLKIDRSTLYELGTPQILYLWSAY